MSVHHSEQTHQDIDLAYARGDRTKYLPLGLAVWTAAPACCGSRSG